MAQARVLKGCPKCGCPAEKIEYLNSGPIIRLVCPKCRFGITEGTDAPIGELKETWNSMENIYREIQTLKEGKTVKNLLDGIEHEPETELNRMWMCRNGKDFWKSASVIGMQVCVMRILSA